MTASLKLDAFRCKQPVKTGKSVSDVVWSSQSQGWILTPYRIETPESVAKNLHSWLGPRDDNIYAKSSDNPFKRDFWAKSRTDILFNQRIDTGEVLLICNISVHDFYRQDCAKRSKLPVLNLPTGRKIRFFAQQGRVVAPIHVKLGIADWHVGPLGGAEFHLNRCREWEWGPKNTKKIHFLVKSRLAGANPLTDFWNV